MTLDEFKRSLSSSTPPDVPPALVALWHDATGDWDAAHSVAQGAVTDRDPAIEALSDGDLHAGAAPATGWRAVG
jgi:hypothetical protein